MKEYYLSMRKTYITKIPDKAGAFLKASQIISSQNGNIVRVNYNKAIDLHTMFIEVSATEENHKKIKSELEKCNYLFNTTDNQKNSHNRFKITRHSRKCDTSS